MNTVRQLKILHQRESRILKQLDENRQRQREAIERLQIEALSVDLDRHQVAELLEYNYYHLSRLDIPFDGRTIKYHDLLEWTEANKPSRVKKLKKNFNELGELV